MKLYKIAIIFIALCMSSCKEEFLEKAPLDNPSSATFFSNQKELEIALNGAYRSLYWHSYKVPYVLWLDAATDLAWSRGDFGGVLTIQGGQFTPETEIFYTVWSHMYT